MVKMILVKLGGSVITDKTQYHKFKKAATDRLAMEIKNAGQKVIVVHGAGSFGHVQAKKFSLQRGHLDESQIPGVAKVMLDVRELNQRVMMAFEAAELPAASIAPASCAQLKEGALTFLDMEPFKGFMKLDITPVTFGDIALDGRRGFGICSGDQLMLALAHEFHPERIVFCADVDGIYTSDPNLDKDAELIERVDRSVLNALPRTERAQDVTGGIFGKIEAMLQMTGRSGQAWVINGNVPGRLEQALKGEAVVGSIVGEG
jgi:isopentenyl phosphate kinase